MIGVKVQTGERNIAAEFFELFKTPWEFYRAGNAYDVIVATEPLPQERAAQILYSSQSLSGDPPVRVLHPSNRPLELDELSLPLYGRLAVFDTRPQSPAMLYCAGQKAGFRRPEDGRETIRIGYDLFAEVEHLLTRGQPPEWAERPALEQHIELLRSLILSLGLPLVEIPPTPAGFSLSACLTHDVDFVGIRDHGFGHTTQGFLQRALFGSVPRMLRNELTFRQMLTNWGAAASLPLVHLGLRQDFWLEFERYQSLEGDHPSTYFFIPYRDRPGRQVHLPHPERRAASYTLEGVRPHIRQLHEHGDEIALHGIDAWLDPASAVDEKLRLSLATGLPCTGNRIHWLCFGPSSCAVLDEAGFDYDSTCGYNETVGFKAGTCQVFRPPGTHHLLELPMHLQDVALFYPSSMGLNPAAAWRECAKVVDTIAHYGGVATILWHTRSLSPERLWEAPYARLIRELERRRAWFGTAADITEWFRARRALNMSQVQVSPRQCRLRLEGAPHAPGFTIRIHVPAADGIVRQYDLPWNGDPEVRIDLMAHDAQEHKFKSAPSPAPEEVSRP